MTHQRGAAQGTAPTLTTACATIASTAGEMPANSAVTAVVVPNAMYTADSTNMQIAPGSTNSAGQQPAADAR